MEVRSNSDARLVTNRYFHRIGQAIKAPLAVLHARPNHLPLPPHREARLARYGSRLQGQGNDDEAKAGFLREAKAAAGLYNNIILEGV